MTRRVTISGLALLTLLCFEAGARPVATRDGILFAFDAPGASQVFVAGDFNAWAPAKDALTKVEGTRWEIRLSLKPGRYEYKFVVDGKDWHQDPDNPLSAPDPYAGKNSVVIVSEDGSLDYLGKGRAGSVEPVVGSLRAYPKPLHLAILWHQHQPRYFKDAKTGEYLEPWVRIHGIKDYYDMVAILEAYPGIKFTVNLTPVLLSQLDEMIAGYDKYVAGREGHLSGSGGKPGFIAGCDMWVRLTLTPPESLTYDEKALILRNFFRMPRETMLDQYPRFKELADKKKGDNDEAIRTTIAAFTNDDWRDLQAWFNLAEFDPDFKEGDVLLPDGQTVSVARLVAKGRGFTEADRAEIIDTQFKILRNIIPAHKRFQDRGQIEIITSPFYHPILPLLCDTDVAREADPRLTLPEKRFSYPQDAAAQVEMACDAYQAYFGKRPRGMWPSEGAVSEAVVPVVADAGITWIATDEEILAKSLGTATLAPHDKYRCYYAGKGGKPIGIIFRDHNLSDDIGFRYSKINGVEAANDLIRKLHEIHEALQNSEGDHVVPIILDGENAWENFERDGKEFLNSLYSQVSEASWLVPVTISEYFDKVPTTTTLAHLAPGSWIAPNFNTWIGENEENKAWNYLETVREGIDAKRAGLTDQARQEVMNEAYVAEGSDWFWWYGLDQNSGNDESFDNAFRGTLTNIYTMLGETRPQYLWVPIVSTASIEPSRAISGMVSPVLDGTLGEPFEWDRAAYLADTPAAGTEEAGEDMVRGLYYGYDAENLWLRLDIGIPLDDLAARECRASVYFSGKNDLASEAYAKIQPGVPGHAFGFGITSKLDVVFGRDGLFAAFSAADGRGGWTREKSLRVSGSQMIEVAVPFALLELGTGDDLEFGVIGYCGGEEQDLLPDQGFLAFKIPPLGGISYLKTLEDPRDDDYGPGTYVYPSDPVFVDGSFDITSLEVMLDAESNVIFKVAIAGEVASPWGGITGYSLQAVDLYIDLDGIPDSGQRDLFLARKARTVPENAWEYFVRASMDSVGMYDRGGRRLDTVAVTSYADPATSSIFIKFPRAAVGAAEGWNVIVAMLGHDGYSEGGIRAVKANREQWVFGGCDRENLCPNIIDLVADDGQSQEDILGSYKATGELSEIPAIGIRFP